MTTKTKTPEQLREQALKLAQQAAEAQAELDAHSLREYEREQDERRKADEALVAGFDRDALDKAVTDARSALDAAVSDLPVTQALAAFLAAQYRRNWAHLDLSSALGRLGRNTDTGHISGTTELDFADLISTVAQRDAQAAIDTDRSQA